MKKILIILACLMPALSYASTSDGHEFVPHMLTGLILIILGAKIGGDIFIRLGQPAVLGELIFGMLLGNLSLLGFNAFDFMKTDQSFQILSELGVIILLFQVGLETNISEMKKVGLSSLVVAILGVITPFILGYYVSCYFIPQAEFLLHIFVGATLTATSVGITARVLKDLGKIQTKEGQIILGAAVIDDVLGLLVLAVVTGLITSANSGQEFETTGLIKIIILAVSFLLGAIVVGQKLSKYLFQIARKLQSEGLLLGTSLLICFGFSLLAHLVGLAPIVGAFTAGLILDPVHYKDIKSNEEQHLEHLIEPISSLLVPIFFVVMGAKVDISVFFDNQILLYAAFLSVAAIIGKQICSLGVLEKGLDKFAVGIGMIPRGEVGLIFAGIGAGMKLHGVPVVDNITFGAVVAMVIITTVVTPPLLKWKLSER